MTKPTTIRRGRKMTIEVDGVPVHLDATHLSTISEHSIHKMNETSMDADSMCESSYDSSEELENEPRWPNRKEAIEATKAKFKKETEHLGGAFNPFKDRIPQSELFKRKEVESDSDYTDTSDFDCGGEEEKEDETNKTLESIIIDRENTPKKQQETKEKELPVTPTQTKTACVVNSDDSMVLCSQQSTSTPKANHTIYGNRHHLSMTCFEISSVLDCSDPAVKQIPPVPSRRSLVHPALEANAAYEQEKAEIAKKAEAILNESFKKEACDQNKTFTIELEKSTGDNLKDSSTKNDVPQKEPEASKRRSTFTANQGPIKDGTFLIAKDGTQNGTYTVKQDSLNNGTYTINEKSDAQPSSKDQSVQDMEVDVTPIRTNDRRGSLKIAANRSSARRSILFAQEEKEREEEKHEKNKEAHNISPVSSQNLFVKPALPQPRLSLLPKKKGEFIARRQSLWTSSRMSISQSTTNGTQAESLRDKYCIPYNTTKVQPRLSVVPLPSDKMVSDNMTETGDSSSQKSISDKETTPRSRSGSRSPARPLVHKLLTKTPQPIASRQKMLMKTPDRSLNPKLQKSVNRLSQPKTPHDRQPCLRDMRKSVGSTFSQDLKTPRPGVKSSLLGESSGTSTTGSAQMSFLIMTEQAKSGKVKLPVSRLAKSAQRIRPLLDLDMSGSSSSDRTLHIGKRRESSAVSISQVDENDHPILQDVMNMETTAVNVTSSPSVKQVIIDDSTDTDASEDIGKENREQRQEENARSDSESVESEDDEQNETTQETQHHTEEPELSDAMRHMSVDEDPDITSDFSSVRAISPHDDDDETSDDGTIKHTHPPFAHLFARNADLDDDLDDHENSDCILGSNFNAERASAGRDYGGDEDDHFDSTMDQERRRRPMSGSAGRRRSPCLPHLDDSMYSASGDTPIRKTRGRGKLIFDSEDEIATPIRARFDPNISQQSSMSADETLLVVEEVEKEKKEKVMQLAPRKIIKADERAAIVSGRPQRNRVKPVRRWLGETLTYARSPGGSHTLTNVNPVEIKDKLYLRYGTCDLKKIAEKEKETRRRKAAIAKKRKEKRRRRSDSDDN